NGDLEAFRESCSRRRMCFVAQFYANEGDVGGNGKDVGALGRSVAVAILCFCCCSRCEDDRHIIASLLEVCMVSVEAGIHPGPFHYRKYREGMGEREGK